MPNITPNIGLHPQTSPNPLNDYLSSLNAIKQLEVGLVLPGHEQPFTNLKQRVEQLIQHHGARNSEILKVLDDEQKAAYQIATKLTWMGDVSGVSWSNLGPWDKRMAVLETLSHLEAMKDMGKVDKFTRGDIVYYRHKNG